MRVILLQVEGLGLSRENTQTMENQIENQMGTGVVMLGTYWGNGKENGNYYYFGLYRDDGKQNGSYYNLFLRMDGCHVGFRIGGLGFGVWV